ncbi:type I-C CRISPR-associated protein Cas7/Csd2 [Murdochiella sp. Marseille-P8839]|nr:type I-C CRISPR-associated protein Cas7/Csd2 [Murdochiella sp. Marseille-P8839]
MNKVDFIVTVVVRNANPNGDPLAGNMPRTDSFGYGEISDVCIKRKIRNRYQDFGNDIFVKAKERIDDDCDSLEKRYKKHFKSSDSDEDIEKGFNEKWIDVRAFGQVITYVSKSIGIRGAVSIGMAKSLRPIEISSLQITKSTNGMDKGKNGKSKDTMGMKHSVDFGVYVFNGAINSYFADKTGFSKEDKEQLKEALRTLFVNDASSARPDGSMEVKDIYWFEHSCPIGDVSSAKIRELLEYEENATAKNYEDYQIHLNEEKLHEYEEKGLRCEKIEGI